MRRPARVLFIVVAGLLATAPQVLAQVVSRAGTPAWFPQETPEAAADQRPEPDAHPIHLALGMFVGANALDTIVTFHLVSAHGDLVRETNPLLSVFEKQPVSLALAKTSIAVLTSYLLIKQHKEHPWRTFWIALGGATAYTTIAALNWRHNP